jgi:hypothetical protein
MVLCTEFEGCSTILITALQSGSALCNLPYALRIALLLFFLLLMMLVNPWRGWSNQVFESRPKSPGNPPQATWLLRPSALSMLLGVGFYAFWGLHEPCPGPRLSFFFGVIAIVVARVIRRWEHEAERK